MPRCHAVIVTAAGSSTRFNASSGSSVKKEFLSIGTEPILVRAIRPFMDVPGLSLIAVTYREGDLDEVKAMVDPLKAGRDDLDIMYVKGGATRQQSVFNALKAINDSRKSRDVELVSIHDGARPFLDAALVNACLDAAATYGGACPCIRVTDTLMKVGEDGLLCGRLDRDGVCTVQTPQTFRFPDILHAHEAAGTGVLYTDDTGIFMDWGGKVAFVPGSAANRKITYSTDLDAGGAGR